MNKKIFKKLLAIMVIFQLIAASFSSNHIFAAADKQKPVITISLTAGATSGESKLVINITDNKSVKTVKYAVGSHRKTFFTNSFYAKKVKNVSVTSTKSISTRISAKNNNTYTIYAEDTAGNSVIKKVRVAVSNALSDKTSTADNSGKTTVSGNNDEVRAVWITFLEFSSKGYTEATFNSRINEMFNHIAGSGMNTVYVHVRPFSDAMYNSKYFPWSRYASGVQGVNPGFDPLSIMVKAAHERNLKIHAYINPYRVSTEGDFKSLAVNNPAYIWLNDGDESNDRNVLKFNNMYYYNPSSEEVIELINNGVKEIVQNYDVDGIIFDDYFYPTLGKDYKKNFDAQEYELYSELSESQGITPLSIVDWRKNNINKMVKNVYSTVKKSGNRTFGISPAGNLDNLRAVDKYYVDIDLWGSEEGFVDYLAPQQYWGFENKYVPFDANVDRWAALVKNPNIKLYVALPVYKAQAQDTSEWVNNKDILARMLNGLRARNLKGFSLYRYDYMTAAFLTKDGALKEYNNLMKVINSN